MQEKLPSFFLQQAYLLHEIAAKYICINYNYNEQSCVCCFLLLSHTAMKAPRRVLSLVISASSGQHFTQFLTYMKLKHSDKY